MKTMPTRIDGELFESAKVAGEVQSRSAAQQLDHWARIGRELESSPTVTHDVIDNVLSGRALYDELSERGQAVVRAAWNDEVSTRIAKLDFEESLRATGLPWAEADGEGNTVIRAANSA